MKKLTLCIATMFSVALISCQKDISYSCDQKIDKWVKANFDDVSKMTRSEWKELDIKYARASYSAFSPDQKFDFWTEKMDEVLKLDWSKMEREHLLKLMDFLNDNKRLFDKKSKEDNSYNDYVEIFQYKWMEYAIADLGWNKKLIFSIVASGYEIKDRTGALALQVQSFAIPIEQPSDDYELRDCTCSTENDWCLFSRCGTKYGGCKEVLKSCGWWYHYDCNGQCDG